MKARLLGGIAAIILAIVGTVMLVNYVGGADARALEGTQTANVVVVRQAIDAGMPVSDFGSAVEVKQVPINMMAEGALEDLKGVQSQVAAMKLLPGDQVSSARLSDPATFKDSNPIEVPETMQQLSFTVSAERVVGGQIHSGEYAALFLSYNQGVEPGTPDIPATKMTLRKALVVSMQASGQGSNSPAAAPTDNPSSGAPAAVGPSNWVVTVALAPAEAIKLVHAAEFGHVWVAKEAAGATDNTPAPLFKGDVFK